MSVRSKSQNMSRTSRSREESKCNPKTHRPKVYNDPQLLTKRKVGINNSTSKQMYKFGSQKRFSSFAKPYDAFFYDIPVMKDNFTTTFGYGKKYDVFKNIMSGKSHTYYDIPREFEIKRRNTPQYSFGKGRDICKRYEIDNDKKTPGPGTYNLREPLGKSALKFSIFGREWDSRKISPSHAAITPGPGHYEETLKTNNVGNYVSSLYTNTWQIKFAGPEKMKRIYDKNPPVGAYELGTMFNKTGLQFSSKYNSTMAKTMSDRPADFYCPYRKTGLPGPGTYDVFSDFNGYTNACKKCRCGCGRKMEKCATEGKIKGSEDDNENGYQNTVS